MIISGLTVENQRLSLKTPQKFFTLIGHRK